MKHLLQYLSAENIVITITGAVIAYYLVFELLP